MKTMKRLQVATAAASLFAIAGAATAGQINSTGTTVAVEVIQPNAAGDLSNVRAPNWGMTYSGGPTVGANSIQHFQLAATLLNGGEWAFDNLAPTGLVPGFAVDPDALAKTIQATVDNKRVAVVGPSTTIADGTYAIVLTAVLRGDRVVNSPNFSTTNPRSVTYVFQLVNKTNNSVFLRGLDIKVNTSKDAPPANFIATPADPANPYFGASRADIATDATARFGAVYKLSSLSSAATGHLGATAAPAATAAPNPLTQFGCDVGTTRFVGINVIIGEGETFQLSGENPFLVGDPRHTSINYLGLSRATDMILLKGPDRQIQTTNSFQTNLGSTPINGIGGTGGGRFTFKPLFSQTTNNYGGINNGSGAYQVGAAGVNNAPGRVETHPVVTRSIDDRSVRIGTLRFSNRSTGALDRLVDSDFYGFKAEDATGAPNLVVTAQPQQISGQNTAGDFSYTPGAANVWGGVDIQRSATSVNLALSFRSKPNYSGFANPTRNAAGVGIGLSASGRLALVRGVGDILGLSGEAAANACGATPPAGAIFADNNNFAEQPAGSGNYSWSIAASQLGANAAATLLGDWHLCYYVDGNSNVPNTFFSNAQATLFKDDTTEQTLTSCPAPLATIQGGVKVDVRHFQAVTSDNSWLSVVRVINNSETDTAVVEGQYIWDDGRYGLWGTLGTLAPRASINLSSTQIAGLLTTAPITLPAASVNGAVPRDTKTRLRIAADVSTIRVQNYFYNVQTGLLSEVSAAQGADFVNVDSSNRDHIDQDAQTEIVK